MRKTIALLAGLLAVMLALVSVLPWGLPAAETMVPGPEPLPEGNIQVAENRALVSRIYTLQDQQLSTLYEESRLHGGKESRIVHVAASAEQETWFVRVYEDGMEWELMKLENGGAVSVYQDLFQEPGTVTGLAAGEGSVWVTLVGDNEAIFIYEYTADTGCALRYLIPAWWLWDTVRAEYDGEIIRATTEQGDICFLTVTGGKTYDEAAGEMALPDWTAESAGEWLLCKRSVLAAALLLWAVVALSVLVSRSVIRRADRLAARLAAAGSEVGFLMLLAAVLLTAYHLLMAAGVGKMAKALPTLAAAAAGIWLFGSLLIRLIAGGMTKPLAELTHQMDDVAEGRIRIREVPPGRDELYRMDRSMQEMCMSLSIRDYELKSTVRSYERFVPEKLTELLERAAVSEVELGDSRRLERNVGLFSVGNRAEARNALEDDAFVDFINHTFGIFQSCVQKNHGSMISSGLRLSAMETMFPDSAVDGVQAGLDFLGLAQKKTTGGIPVPVPFLMLHRASFLYGVAGQEERLFPYLSSGELEFLGSFVPRFHEIGVRMVMTESYWKQLEGSGYVARYIGFVSDEDKGAYKLYEVLDAYPELEKKLRWGYDQRFQEAINLFYHNDFFLARNLFSALLRACPEDGIVRWYLFACECYFNQDGAGEVDYQLFGVNGA